MKAPEDYPDVVQRVLDAADAALDAGWVRFIESNIMDGDDAAVVDDALQAAVLGDLSIPADILDAVEDQYLGDDAVKAADQEHIAGWVAQLRSKLALVS